MKFCRLSQQSTFVARNHSSSMLSFSLSVYSQRTIYCVHVSVYMCLYTCVCIHVSVYLCLYTCVCTHVPVHMCLYTRVCIHVSAYMCMYACVCTHVSVYMRIHASVYMHVYTRIHASVHICHVPVVPSIISNGRCQSFVRHCMRC